MRRCVGSFGVGIVVSVAVATAATAADVIDIRSAQVPGGRGTRVTVSLSYACDAASGAKAVRVEVGDAATFASGAGTVPATCDGASYPVDVTVSSHDSLPFRRGDDLTVDASLRGGDGKVVDGGRTSRVVKAG